MAEWPGPKLVNVGVLNIAVYEYGDRSNPAVLLLHGGLSTGLTWHDVSVELAKEHFVIATDSRGRGFSDHAPNGDYSTNAFVADAKAIADHLGIQTLSVIGHSEGGAIATALAAKHPNIVESLVILENAHDLDFAAMAKAMPENAIKIPIGTSFTNWDDAESWQRSNLVNQDQGVIDRRMHSRFVERNGRVEWREDQSIFPYKAAHPQSANDRLESIKGVRCRTLFLLAANSNLITDAVADEAIANLTEASWIRIPNTGHNVQEDNLPSTVREIRNFLSNA
jgi:pimeloyl-ACP methyl ester carboxylesterase